MSEILSDEELEQARNLGAMTYLSACAHLMARHLGFAFDHDAINQMALQMVDPLNHAMQAAWCTLMDDAPGQESSVINFVKALENM